MSADLQIQFKQITDRCKAHFLLKNKDYGSSWRIMRLSSITDQIFIKARRIRSIQQKHTQKIADGVLGEFEAIINYSVMAMIQAELIDNEELSLPTEQIERLYQYHTAQTLHLLSDKNHDYDQAWRQMRVSSITDIILMKLLRIKQIEDNQGQVMVSEGVLSGYQDILNYAIFAIILTEQEAE